MTNDKITIKANGTLHTFTPEELTTIIEDAKKPTYLVKVKYRGSTSDKEYSYISKENVEVGELVTVPLGEREKRAFVTDVFEIKELVRVGE